MTNVGSFEAKTHLPQLLERVAKGERILITNRGKPMAVHVPPEAAEPTSVEAIGRKMLAYRDRVKRKAGGSFRELAHEGHKLTRFCEASLTTAQMRYTR
jgi:prevent-host-death family protein